jgi:8-oxo-dGTP pyrophosphatase MutT (NUDIX family)
MRRNNAYLVINRNDERGFSFPGGIQMPWENADRALVREVLEETGLEVTRLTFKSRYYSATEVPVNLTVFEIEAQGELRGSWEGMPCWLPIQEFSDRLLPSQRRILELLQ